MSGHVSGASARLQELYPNTKYTLLTAAIMLKYCACKTQAKYYPPRAPEGIHMHGYAPCKKSWIYTRKAPSNTINDTI